MMIVGYWKIEILQKVCLKLNVSIDSSYKAFIRYDSLKACDYLNFQPDANSLEGQVSENLA